MESNNEKIFEVDGKEKSTNSYNSSSTKCWKAAGETNQDVNDVQSSRITSDAVNKRKEKDSSFLNFSSQSSVTSKRSCNNPYLQITKIKEAFREFLFLLPILKMELRKAIPQNESSRSDFLVAKQRLESVVLFHGGNLQRLTSNVSSHRKGNNSHRKKKSSTISKLEIQDKCAGERGIFKDLTESNNNSCKEVSVGKEKIYERASVQSEHDGKSSHQRSTVSRRVIQTLEGPNSTNIFSASLAKTELSSKVGIKEKASMKQYKKKGCEIVIQSAAATEKKRKASPNFQHYSVPKQKQKRYNRQVLQKSVGIMVRIF